MSRLSSLLRILQGDPNGDRVVPPTSLTGNLTLLTAAAMAFLSVFAISLSLAADRLAERWESELSQTSTIRISAPPEELDIQTRAVQDVLRTTPGVANSRVLSDEEQRLLLQPWFGPDLPVEELPLPRLVEVVEDKTGYDAEGLKLRLAGEAPGAILDDHTRWRKPLIAAAQRLRSLGLISILLIVISLTAMVTLAARAALSANSQVIQVTRLIGATDAYIARAFVRRFTIRTLLGAFAGTILGMISIALLPDASPDGVFLTGLGFQGVEWFWPLFVPLFSMLVALFATRQSAFSILRRGT